MARPGMGRGPRGPSWHLMLLVFGWLAPFAGAQPTAQQPAQTAPPGSMTPSALFAALQQLQTALPVAYWTANLYPWEPGMVCQVAGMLDMRPRAEKVVGTWQEGQSLVWTARTNPACQVGVGAIRFAHPAAARAYYGLAIDLQRKQDERPGALSRHQQPVLASQSRPVKLPGAEEAVCVDKRIQLSPESPPAAITTLLARSGDLVVEWNWRDVAPDLAWAEKVLAGLLTRVPKQPAESPRLRWEFQNPFGR